jgi:UDP-GlcNAc:undecaprenyl-phosphate GlcNAc-1-phosphate transferase
VHLGFITNPLGGILHLDSIKVTLFGTFHLVLADLLGIIWIIWVMNMLNWSKGVDGQMPGIVAISAFIIGLLSLRFPLVQQPVLIDATLSFIVAGAALGFLVYNFHPAKILPGFGATSVYLLVAVVSMLSSAKLATAILVMGVPAVDALFTILRRLSARRSPFLGDNKHLHHLLLRFGWTQRKIALFYWGISAILGVIALQLQSRTKMFAIVMLLVFVGGGLYFLHRVIKLKDEKKTA